MPKAQELCVGDKITFWEPNFESEKTPAGRWFRVERGRTWIFAEVVNKTKTGRISMRVLNSNGAKYYSRDKAIHRDSKTLFSDSWDLNLTNRTAEGKLLVCTSESTHPEANAKLDIKSALRGKKSGLQYKPASLNPFSDPVVRACHDNDAREKKNEEN